MRNKFLSLRDTLLCFAGLCLLVIPATAAAGNVRFARHPALSPDGKTVAFSWRGDLWLVAAKGGQARQLTSHGAYDSHPVWSPDGRAIAFASQRHGRNDIYITAVAGGTPVQLTHHEASDTPAFWSRDGKSLYFISDRERSVTQRQSLYRVSTQGGTPMRVFAIGCNGADRSPDGKTLVLSRGERRWWRKHYKMPYHTRLWLFERGPKTFHRLTGKPVPRSKDEIYTASHATWLDLHTVIYRSEKDGHLNLWRYDTRTKQHKQLTHFKQKAVRFPRAAAGGRWVVFTRWDKLHLYDHKTGKISTIDATAHGDRAQNQETRQLLRGKVQEYAVSPTGKEVALVIGGEVFVKGLKDPVKWAQRITNSAWRERELTWSPDGKVLAFVSDRGGQAAIYTAHAGTQGKKTRALHRTLRPKIKRISAPLAKWPEHRPRWSPDGSTIAWIRGAGDLVLYDVATRKERVRLKGWNLDDFRWSPDSQWLLYTRFDDQSNTDIFLLRREGQSKAYNLSRHPDDDRSMVWSANGRLVAFLTRGVNNHYQVQYVYLRKADHDLSREQRQRLFPRWAKAWKRMQAKKRKAKKKAKGSKTAKGHTKVKRPSSRPTKQKVGTSKVVPKAQHKASHLRIDRKGLAFRLRTLRGIPGPEGPNQVLLSPTGDAFFFNVRGRNAGIYRLRWDGRRLRRLAKGSFRALRWGPHHKKLYALAGGGRLVSLSPKKAGRSKGVSFLAELWINQAKSRRQKFEEAWQIIRRWFYDPNFHGVNWQAMRTRYRTLLDAAHTDKDFDDVVSMMIGELNASHMGIYTPYRGVRVKTGDLGLHFDPSHQGPGLKIAKIRPKSPASKKDKTRIRPGDVLLAIQGHTLTSQSNLHWYLRWTVGRPVVLTLRTPKGKRYQQTLYPTGQRNAIQERYKAWVKERQALVKKLSRDQFAYIHIRSMGISSLANFERSLFARAYGKKGLVLDVRNNGGGWTTDLILTMFRPRPHAFTRWRGSGKGYPTFRRPFYYWGNKPVILLCNERSISNAEIFSHAFKNLKLGTLVGMPTYGGVISTRWMRLMDGTYFGVPLRGWWTSPHRINMENNPAVPHIQIPHGPQEEVQGNDKQLKRAVQVLQQQTNSTKK